MKYLLIAYKNGTLVSNTRQDETATLNIIRKAYLAVHHCGDDSADLYALKAMQDANAAIEQGKSLMITLRVDLALKIQKDRSNETA